MNKEEIAEELVEYFQKKEKQKQEMVEQLNSFVPALLLLDPENDKDLVNAKTVMVEGTQFMKALSAFIVADAEMRIELIRLVREQQGQQGPGESPSPCLE